MAQRRAGFVLAVSVPLLAFFMSLSALAVARGSISGLAFRWNAF
jgi:hypothetical protein